MKTHSKVKAIKVESIENRNFLAAELKQSKYALQIYWVKINFTKTSKQIMTERAYHQIQDWSPHQLKVHVSLKEITKGDEFTK